MARAPTSGKGYASARLDSRMVARAVIAGFAFLAYAGVLALWGIGAGQDEPGLFGAVLGGLGLLAVFMGLIGWGEPRRG